MKSWLFGICCFLMGITSVQAQSIPLSARFVQQAAARLARILPHQAQATFSSSSSSSSSSSEEISEEQINSPQDRVACRNAQLVRMFSDKACLPHQAQATFSSSSSSSSSSSEEISEEQINSPQDRVACRNAQLVRMFSDKACLPHQAQATFSSSSSSSSPSSEEISEEQINSPQARKAWLNANSVHVFPDPACPLPAIQHHTPTPRLLPVELFNRHQPGHLDELEKKLIDDYMNRLLYANNFSG